MGKILDWIDKILSKEEKNASVVCALCGKKIEDTAFMMISGSIVVNDKTLHQPQIFPCLEMAFNYAQGFYSHTLCWIARLKELGVSLYNMDKVYKEYNKKKKRR